MTTREAINAAVKEAHDAGLCVIPPREDGSKRPEGFWKQHITARPTLDDLRELYRYERHGLGVVCGSVSGELEVLDFDDRETYQRFKAAAALAGLEDLVERIEASYLEESPAGVHWLWRTEKAGGNTKLAMRQTGPDRFETLIETRGGGGYCILAPSYGAIHPQGAAYVRVMGSFSTIPYVSQLDRDALLEVARKLDECVQDEDVRIPAPTLTPAGGRPGDDFEARADWHGDVLVPAGWTKVAGFGHQEYWRRPGKTEGHSGVLHLDSGYFVPFSSSTPFPETEVGYGKFRSYVHLFHQGDYSAAATALRLKGYGQEKELWTPPPGGLLRGSDVFDLDVPDIDTLPLLGRKGMVMEKGSNLLYAYPKTGKTELVTEVLPEWIVLGKRVVYLTEEPLWFWKPRLRRFKTRTRDFWETLIFVPAFGWGIVKVYELLEQMEFDILLVDTLRNTCGFQEGEGDKDVTRVVIPLIALCRKKDATFFSLYHARKMPGEDGRDISGHHSLYGVFDRALQLRKIAGEENETKRRLTLSGRLITPDTPAGMTYRMNADGHFESLEVALLHDFQNKQKGDAA